MKLFGVIYFAAVLLISASAQAEQEVALPIQEVRYQEGSWTIGVQVLLKNPCVGKPVATVIPDKGNAFTLKVIAEPASGMCAQVVSTRTLTVDLRSLLSNPDLGIRGGELYVLRAERTNFEMEFVGADVLASLPTPRPVVHTMEIGPAEL